MNIKLLIFFLVLQMPVFLWAQEYNDVKVEEVFQKDIIAMLPPLSNLIDSAEKHSPLLKMYQADLVIQELKIKSSKREWMRNLGFEAGVRYGLLDNVLVSQDPWGNAFNQNKETRYNVGVFFKIPLSNIYDRSSVKISRQEKEKSVYQLEKIHEELRQLVIIQYNNIIKAHRILGIRIKSLSLYIIQVERAEKDFLNGQITISDYSRLSEMLSNAQINLEANKIEFITALQLLQESVGIRIELKQ